MSKPQLLFVDHEFHRKTKSSEFMVETLKQRFDVTVVYVDAAAPIDWEGLKQPQEYVVVWQMDFLAAFFIAQQKKVVVIPMYDGSGGMPDPHWLVARQARYINFSSFLHARIVSLGCSSKYVQYFPAPPENAVEKDFSTLRAFFWQRRPDTWLNIDFVDKLFADELDSLHVHTPSDVEHQFNPKSLRKLSTKTTWSDWFDTAEEFEETVSNCNIYIAPRTAEGIGMAFLEAMAQGAIVFANDEPTHNEYISNWQTGILISPTISGISFEDPPTPLNKISENAKTTAKLKHQAWIEGIPEMLDFIEQTPTSVVPNGNRLQTRIRRFVDAYQNGLPAYSQELSQHKMEVEILSGWRDFCAVDDDVESEIINGDSTSIDVVFGYGNCEQFVEDGWSVAENTHRWAVKRIASLKLPSFGRRSVASIEVDARGLGERKIEVLLDSYSVGTIDVADGFTKSLIVPESNIDIDPEKDFEIFLQAVGDPPKRLKGETRTLFFAIRNIRINFA